MAYTHILMATGGAEHSLRAEARAAELAKVLSTELTLISVVRLSSAAGGLAAGLPMESGTLSSQIYDELKEQQERILAEAKARCEEKGVTPSTFMETGNVGRVIVDTAKARECDLIVVGRRKLSVVGAIALGSVSDYVNRHAECDVLIVH